MRICALLLVLLASACSSSHSSGLELMDGGSDAPAPPATDGGPGTIADGGGPTPVPDGGTGVADAGTPATDGGGIFPGFDSGTRTDAGPMPTMPGGVGSACAADADCTMLSGGMCLTMLALGGGFDLTFPGGYCTQSCDGGGFGGTDTCPDGSQCYGGGFGRTGYCTKRCTSDADCRVDEGYVCQNFGGFGPGLCQPPMSGGGGLPMP